MENFNVHLTLYPDECNFDGKKLSLAENCYDL